MAFGSRSSQAVLVLGFLAIIYGVPACQVVVDLRRQRPVQATDLFRRVPSVKNLRGFERALETTWWGQESIRPAMQEALYISLREAGAKAIEGRDGWLFYRPGVDYLIARDRREIESSDTLWAPPPTNRTRRESVVQAIVEYRLQLQQRGIELLVVPVPGKASVYPDKLTRRFASHPDDFRSPTEDLLEELDRQGVPIVQLFDAFRQARRNDSASGTDRAYYLACDTHWTPEGAAVAARAVAEGLRKLGWTCESPFEYGTEEVRVRRRGDIGEMTSIPALARNCRTEEVGCRQILDPLVGPMIPLPGGRAGRFKNDHLIDTPMEASLLVLGDSFCRIYQCAEPASLGEVVESESATAVVEAPGNSKRMLPGSAGFPSRLAYELKAPVDYVVSDGGAATEVRQRVSVDSEILENKRIVIWEFAERDVQLGKAGWNEVPLPPEP